MTKENQKKLYIHFKELAKTGATDKIRMRAADRAAKLLAIYPDFEEKLAEAPKGATTTAKPKKSNNHKPTCKCPICKNMKKKAVK